MSLSGILHSCFESDAEPRRSTIGRSIFGFFQMNAEILRIISMVLVSHPSFMPVASLVFRIGTINLLDHSSATRLINLLHKIVKVMEYLWGCLTRYWQSTKMMALRHAIAQNTETLSKALKNQLGKEATQDYPKVRLIGKFALYSTIFLLQDAELNLTYDQTKMAFFSAICLSILTFRVEFPNLFGFLRRRAGWKVNSISNFASFILAIVFEKFYYKTWRSLIAGFCFAIYFLCVLVIYRPQIELGFFGLVMGIIGSVIYNCYGFKFQMWGIACICFVLFRFKSWVDKYWLDFNQNQALPYTLLGTAGMLLSWPISFVIASSLSVASDVNHGEMGLLFLIISEIALSIYLWWAWRRLNRAALQMLSKGHLPFTTSVKLKNRRAYWWGILYSLIDLLFLLLKMMRTIKLEAILLRRVNTGVVSAVFIVVIACGEMLKDILM